MNYVKLGLSSLAIVALLTACKKEVVVDQNTNPATTVTTPSTTNNNGNVAMEKDLPANALNFLKTNYGNSPVATYEVKDVPVVGKTFEVKLNNGAEIDFDKDGNWTELKDPSGIRSELVPASISKYVETNYKGVNVTSIDKEKNKIKVDLSNDVDLEFDQNGNFVRIDK